MAPNSDNEWLFQEGLLAEVNLRHLGKYRVTLEPDLMKAVCEEIRRRIPKGLTIVEPAEPGGEYEFHYDNPIRKPEDPAS